MDENLDFSFIGNAIKKWFLLILAFIIIGGAGAFFYTTTAPLMYASDTTIYIKPAITDSLEIDYDDIMINSKMVTTYVNMITSRKVIDKVIEELNLNLTYDEVYNMVSVAKVTGTELINIKYISNKSELATSLANTTAETFIYTMSDEMNVGNIVVIDKAVIEEAPVAPNKILIIIIGLVGGMFVGSILGILFETMDKKIKSHEDVKRYLDEKTLGMIPDYSIDEKKKYNDDEFKIIADPSSIVSESFRMLRTNLNFLDLKIINVVSTLPSEGKTETLCNLALSFSALEKKVLIIDCDLRKPKIHKNFGVYRRYGVSDIILSKGSISLKEAIQNYKHEEYSVDILPAGSKVSNPSELINSESFKKILAEARDLYDLVLIDCPPISSMTDGVLVSHLSDGTVYVIQTERADYQVISGCLEDIKSTNSFVLGVVLTKVNIKRNKRLYGHKYDYYYASYNK